MTVFLSFRKLSNTEKLSSAIFLLVKGKGQRARERATHRPCCPQLNRWRRDKSVNLQREDRGSEFDNARLEIKKQ